MLETPQKTMRLLLVDDHTLFRESVARLLLSEAEVQVAASCGSIAEALQILKQEDVDLILLDLDLGSERGEDLHEYLPADYAGKVLLVTAGVEPGKIPDLIRDGIAGVFAKHGAPELLIQAIHEAMEGKTWFEQTLLQSAMRSETNIQAITDSRLTERERQVLKFVFEGLAKICRLLSSRIGSAQPKGGETLERWASGFCTVRNATAGVHGA